MSVLYRSTSVALRSFSGSGGLLNHGSLIHVIRNADDVMKFATGCMFIHQRRWVQPSSASPVAFTLSCPVLPHPTCRLHCAVTHIVILPGQRGNGPARHYSAGPDKQKEGAASDVQKAEDGSEKPLTLFQRFKRTYKEHGKVLVAVHVATSIVWYGSFYAAARCGIDLVPWLEHWGFSEFMIKPFRAGGLGDFALAYLMYKLATPARYTVTLAGTNLVIRHLRNKGKMAPKSDEDSLRSFYELGRQKLKNSNLRKERLKKIREAREKRKSERGKQS